MKKTLERTWQHFKLIGNVRIYHIKMHKILLIFTSNLTQSIYCLTHFGSCEKPASIDKANFNFLQMENCLEFAFKWLSGNFSNVERAQDLALCFKKTRDTIFINLLNSIQMTSLQDLGQDQHQQKNRLHHSVMSTATRTKPRERIVFIQNLTKQVIINNQTNVAN